MTPDETKIWNAAVRKCADSVLYDTRIQFLRHILPETEAEHLALECPATDKVEVIAWMLEREKPALPDYDDEVTIEQIEALKSATEYVYGPEVPGTTTWVKGTEYEYQVIDRAWRKGLCAEQASRGSPRRRVYRIGTQYQHDGSDVCPLADGDQPVEVRYFSDHLVRYNRAGEVDWKCVTRFTPVKEG